MADAAVQVTMALAGQEAKKRKRKRKAKAHTAFQEGTDDLSCVDKVDMTSVVRKKVDVHLPTCW